MTGIVPFRFKSFQLVNKLVPFARQIVDDGKPDIEQLLVGRKRHTEHTPLRVLIIAYPIAFHIRNHLIKDYGSCDNGVRRIRVISQFVGFEVGDTA